MKTRLLTLSFMLAGGLTATCVSAATTTAATQDARPERVTLGGIIDPVINDTPAFTPDGDTVFFDRRQDHHATIMVSHKVDGHWTRPRAASFSRHGDNQDPAMAPDGSYLVFSSDRPVPPDRKPGTWQHKGKKHPGDTLWKVEKVDDHWSKPVWLGPVVNGSMHVYAPSVAADGTLYFIQRDSGHAMHIFRSRRRDGHYLPPVRVRLGYRQASTHDPSIAPDQSFIVFDYSRANEGMGRLSIAFREGDHWSHPIDLGDAVNALKPWGSHLAPGARSVYFTGNDGVYRLSLQPWLHRHGQSSSLKQ